MNDINRFELLCVTMNQNDFSKIKTMNIHSNVVFANQANNFGYKEIVFDHNKIAKMITTNTKGVGINRNLAIMYSSADICLFADDDVTYFDDVESIVLSEFEKHNDADIFIFHLNSNDSNRQQKQYKKTRKAHKIERMPWGGCRIAVRRNSILKSNIWFTTLLGGGCVFPCGEDSLWLATAKKEKLKLYISNKTIGNVSFETSSWFTSEWKEEYYYGQGAGIQATYPRSALIWVLYTLWRTRKYKSISLTTKIKWIHYGRKGFKKVISFSDFKKTIKD